MTLTTQDSPAIPPSAGNEPVEPEIQGSGRQVVQLLIGVAVITALFLLLGWGALLLFIVILIAIVMLHELGHFATAKWAGMKVTEYFVGFGPRLWSIRRGETEYGVKAIPAGGYVRITGFTAMEEVPEEDEQRAYRQQPFYQRIVVASAGSVMHLLIAFVLAIIVVFAFGQPTNNSRSTARRALARQGDAGRVGGAEGGRRHRLHRRQDLQQPERRNRHHQALDRQGAHARCRARRPAHQPRGDAGERQGDQGRRDEAR